MKWKIITYCGSFWMSITDCKDGYIRYSTLWNLNVMSMRQDWELYYLTSSDNKEEFWLVYANWNTIPIDELQFYKDFYQVELSSTIPNLKKICADFHLEEQRRLKAISKDAIPDELMDFDEYIEEPSSTPLARFPETTQHQSDEEILRLLGQHWIHTSSDIRLLLTISFSTLTSDMNRIARELIEVAHQTTTNRELKVNLVSAYWQLQRLR